MKSYAFFDVDDTIISIKSMFSFLALYFEIYPDDELQDEFDREMKTLIEKDTDWEIVNKRYYAYFKNFPIERVEHASLEWFKKYSSSEDFYHKNVLNEISRHQSNGVECVFVSGSFVELLKPIANDLNVKSILAINVERDKLMYTGEIIPPQTIGNGKAVALKEFMKNNSASAADCYAYGDDISDAPMLAVVGKPVAVSGGRRLVDFAKDKGWKIINPD